MYVFFAAIKTGVSPAKCPRRKKAWENPAVAKVVLGDVFLFYCQLTSIYSLVVLKNYVIV